MSLRDELGALELEAPGAPEAEPECERVTETVAETCEPLTEPERTAEVTVTLAESVFDALSVALLEGAAAVPEPDAETDEQKSSST
jgi:hypothetical protein